MRHAIRLALICGLVLLSASTADAQGRKGPAPHVRNNAATAPHRPQNNTRSAVGRMWGGNAYAYGELMQERMIIQQQRYMLQQQRYMMQQMQKNNQANAKAKAKSGTPDSANVNKPDPEPVYHKTYKHGRVDPNFKPRPGTAK